jgi:O-antigen ligase
VRAAVSPSVRPGRNPSARPSRGRTVGSQEPELGQGPALRVSDVAAPAALVLLLFIGLFKGAPFMRWAPVDLTAACMAVVGVGVGWHLLAQRGHVRLSIWALAGVALAVPAAFYPISNPEAPEKRLRLLIPLLAVAGVCYLVRTQRRQQVWIWLHVAVGVVLVATGVNLDDDAASRFTGAGATTIGAGRASGVSILVLLVLLITGGLARWWSKALALVVVAWLAVALISTGSRGPVFSCAAAVLLVATVALGRYRLLRALAALGTIAAGWFLLTEATGLGATRITNSVTGEYSLTGSRTGLWAEAVQGIAAHPIGIGWGNFWAQLSPAERLDSGYNQYPHNVLLEVTLEAGWLAGAALVVFVVASLLRLYRVSSSPEGSALLGIAVFFVLNALVSGDVNDNRTMWVALAIAWVSVSRAHPAPGGGSGPPAGSGLRHQRGDGGERLGPHLLGRSVVDQLASERAHPTVPARQAHPARNGEVVARPVGLGIEGVAAGRLAGSGPGGDPPEEGAGQA